MKDKDEIKKTDKVISEAYNTQLLSLLFGNNLFYKSRALFILNTQNLNILDFTKYNISKENSKSFLESMLISQFIFKHDDFFRHNIIIETESNNIKSGRVIDFDKKFNFNKKEKSEFDINDIKKYFSSFWDPNPMGPLIMHYENYIDINGKPIFDFSKHKNLSPREIWDKIKDTVIKPNTGGKYPQHIKKEETSLENAFNNIFQYNFSKIDWSFCNLFSDNEEDINEQLNQISENSFIKNAAYILLKRKIETIYTFALKNTNNQIKKNNIQIINDLLIEFGFKQDEINQLPFRQKIMEAIKLSFVFQIKNRGIFAEMVEQFDNKECTETMLQIIEKVCNSDRNKIIDFCKETIDKDPDIDNKLNYMLDNAKFVLTQIKKNPEFKDKATELKGKLKNFKNECVKSEPNQIRKYCKFYLACGLAGVIMGGLFVGVSFVTPIVGTVDSIASKAILGLGIFTIALGIIALIKYCFLEKNKMEIDSKIGVNPEIETNSISSKQENLIGKFNPNFN